MDSSQDQCKHNRISRNCYLCHMECVGGTLKEKYEFDTMQQNISRLEIRTTKLEQYARLQADHNALQEEINRTLNNYIKELQQQHIKIERDYHELVRMHDNRISATEKNIRFMMGDPSAQVHKPKVHAGQEGELSPLKFPLQKTTGLTFEEAITAFKAGKKIMVRDDRCVSCIYEPISDYVYGFEFSHMLSNNWEIVE